MSGKAFRAVEQLESRNMLSAAPTVDAVDIAQHAVVAYQPFTVLVEANDDVRVHGVSMFMDLNDDARWDPLVDRPLGDRFQRNGQGKFEFNFIADASWPAWAHIYADAVDEEGQWSNGLRGQSIIPTTLPLVTMLSANAGPWAGIPEDSSLSLRAIVDDPFRHSSYAEGVTFFIDNNANGRWDSGVDVDLGFSREMDSEGAFILQTTQPMLALGQSIAAAAKISDSRFDFTNGFGPVRVTPYNIFVDSPVISNIVAENLSGRIGPADGPIFQVGDRVRFTIDVQGRRDLQSATLFFDANSNGRWDRGVDTDLGAFWFAPDVFAGRARIDFTITPSMNFDYRAFVVASRYDGLNRFWEGGDFNWGATRTEWVKINSPAWLENIQAIPPDVVGEPLHVSFTARDDHSVSRFLAFIDVNDNGAIDIGEASSRIATRVSGTFTNGRWSMAIDVSGVASGTHKLKIYASDFEDSAGPTYVVDVTI